MPIYEYKCEDCGKAVEILQKGRNSEPVECPECGSKNLKRLLSRPGAILMKGSSTEATTCCGRTEPCDRPPCTDTGVCRRS